MNRIAFILSFLAFTASLNAQGRLHVIKPFKVATIDKFGTFRVSLGLDISTPMHLALGFLSGFISGQDFNRGLAIGIEYSDGFNTANGADLGDIIAHEIGFTIHKKLNLPTLFDKEKNLQHQTMFLEQKHVDQNKEDKENRDRITYRDLLMHIGEVVLAHLNDEESKLDTETVALEAIIKINYLTSTIVKRAEIETDLKR